jgi:hypothetical protein
MSGISLTLPSDGETIEAADVNVPFNAIASVINGGIDNANISNVSGAKLDAATVPATALGTDLRAGWITGALAAPNTITYEGNRSQKVTWNSVDYSSVLTPGMRGRFSRSVAAPTQVTSLNGTTQYWTKTSPNKLTFTDDFVISAYIKLTSYPSVQAGIISRNNGTSGWELKVTSDGRVNLVGYNAGAGNNSYVVSYQSVPLNQWVHITAQLDMSTFTVSTSTSYIMIDGIDVPCSVARNGTNPTALVQAGDLQIGAINGGSFFTGKIAHAAIFNAKVTQSTIRSYITQGYSGSETSLASAYSFNGVATDINTTTPNDLSAVSSAGYVTDSPFANGSGSTYDYGILQAVTYTGSNTETYWQMAEANSVPTSGGVSAVAYSPYKSPVGFPVSRGRWEVSSILMVNNAAATSAATSYNNASMRLTVPVGDFSLAYMGNLYAVDSAGTSGQISTNLSTTAASTAALSGKLTTNSYAIATGASATGAMHRIYAEDSVSMTSATVVYCNLYTENALDGAYWYTPLAMTGGARNLTIYAVPAGL